MRTVVDQAIVLRRTNYGEADRIVSFLTYRNGKVTGLVRGVRKPKSKLAAGVEPFCINEICFARGRGELSTITSARLVQHHTNFLSDLTKLELAQQILKTIDSKVAENASSDFFMLLKATIEQVNSNLDASLIEVWWLVNLAQISGNGLSLKKQIDGQALVEEKGYAFDIENGGFLAHPEGSFRANHIKFLKLAGNSMPEQLANIVGVEDLTIQLLPSLRSFAKLHFN